MGSIAQVGSGGWAKWKMGEGVSVQVGLAVVSLCGAELCFEERRALLYHHLIVAISLLVRSFHFRRETDCYLRCRLAWRFGGSEERECEVVDLLADRNDATEESIVLAD